MNETEQQTTSADATIQPNVQQEAARADASAQESIETKPGQEATLCQEGDSCITDESAAIYPTQENSEACSANNQEQTEETSQMAPIGTKNPTESNVMGTPSEDKPEVPDCDSVFEEIRTRLEHVEEGFPALAKAFRQLSGTVADLYAANTDKMHAKIERYERGLEKSLEKPYLLAILEICDAFRDALRIAEETPESALAALQSIRASIDVPIWNFGLREIEIEPGVTRFSPRLHEAKATVPAPDESLHGVVHSVINAGFTEIPDSDDSNSRPVVFRAARVKVYKWMPGASASSITSTSI